MKNPVDEYMGIRKKAAWPFGPGAGRGVGSVAGQGFGSRVTDQLAGGAGQAIAGAAITGAGVAAMKIYQALRKRGDFKGMMQANPDLHEMQAQNPERFNTHYNSLRTMNPGYAQDPIISGTYMRQMSQYPETAGNVLLMGLESRAKTGPTLDTKLGPASLKTNL